MRIYLPLTRSYRPRRKTAIHALGHVRLPGEADELPLFSAVKGTHLRPWGQPGRNGQKDLWLWHNLAGFVSLGQGENLALWLAPREE